MSEIAPAGQTNLVIIEAKNFLKAPAAADAQTAMNESIHASPTEQSTQTSKSKMLWICRKQKLLYY